MGKLKSICSLFYIFFSSMLLSQSGVEDQTEQWFDSAFVANNINWSETESEFLRFSKTNFEQVDSLEEFYQTLMTNTSQSNPKKLPSIKTSGFNTLDRFADISAQLIPELQHHILRVIEGSGKWCRSNKFTDYYFILHEISYWSLESTNIYSLISRLLTLKDGVKNPTLYHKMVLLVIVEKLFNNYEFFSRNTKAELAYSQITVTKVKKTKQKRTSKNDSSDSSDSGFTDPCFLGGESTMIRYLQNNVNYPEEAQQKGIDGTVYISFVVGVDGSISDLGIEKSPHIILSKETIRVVENMPNWKPGTQGETKIRVRYTLPLKFTISK